MDINKKLSYYKTNTSAKPEPAIPSSLSALKEEFGAEICTVNAPYLKIEQKHSFKFPAKVSLNLLSKKIFNNPIHLNQCLFFDLETTGLAGGAGTYPFLQGFGYFHEDGFQVEQFFLPDFGREYYLYEYLQDKLSKFKYLVSFNGKSYDLPLLKNRFILNRIKINWQRFKHIDLLHI